MNPWSKKIILITFLIFFSGVGSSSLLGFDLVSHREKRNNETFFDIGSKKNIQNGKRVWKKSNNNLLNEKIYWEKIKEKDFNLLKKEYKTTKKDSDFSFNSLNRSIVFDNFRVGPDIRWLVPPGLVWNNINKFDASIRGHSRRGKGEEFLSWNNGDAVGQFYYQFLNNMKSSFGINIGMRSVYQGSTNSSPVGEGISAGFRFDHKLSDDSGIALGAEQLLHFDGLTDTGRDVYLTASKVFKSNKKKDLFPLYVLTGGFGTGKLAEGAIKGLCSDLFGGAGNNISEQYRLCWAPIFSIAFLPNKSFSTFAEYNSHSFILGTSYAPLEEVPLRGTFAVKLTDEDNYELNNFSEMTWIFRISLGI